MKNLLDSILLTPKAVADWHGACRSAALGGMLTGLRLAPADEDARVLEGGDLEIFVALDRGREMSIRIPPEGWAWVPDAVQ